MGAGCSGLQPSPAWAPRRLELGALSALRMPRPGSGWQSGQVAQPCQEAGFRHKDAAPFSLSQLLSRNQLLRLSPSAQTLLSAPERVVGSLLAAATVIGSNPAPLGACPLVSMATPLLSKHKGASFYEIIKPNFAVWVHLPSRGLGIPETKPGNGRASPDPTPGAGPSHSPDPSNTHGGLPPREGLPIPSVSCPPIPSFHLSPQPLPPSCPPSSPDSAAPCTRPFRPLGLPSRWSHLPIRGPGLHPVPPAHRLPPGRLPALSLMPHLCQPHWSWSSASTQRARVVRKQPCCALAHTHGNHSAHKETRR